MKEEKKKKKSAKKQSKRCTLKEIVQYDCEINSAGRTQCFAVRRIFQLCEGRPALEVTHVVDFDEQGEAKLKPGYEKLRPPASKWKP
ncbi:hypothetical protein V8E36_003181 [Tilletia maclaganii]